MKVYVTKYALTKGIFYLDVLRIRPAPNDVVYYKRDKNTPSIVIRKTDWFFNWDEALARANDLREKEIEYSKNRIKKLKAVDFSITEVKTVL